MLQTLLFLVSTHAQAPGPTAEEFPIPTVQQEVLNNIRAQPIGVATVADLALPEPFLRRFADRVTLQSFEENFRVVVADEPPDLTPPVTAAEGAGETSKGTNAGASESKSNTWRIAIGVGGAALAAVVLLMRRRKA